MKLRAKAEAMRCLTESRHGAISDVYGDRSCDSMVTRLNGLRREVTEQDRAQLEYVMPLIQSGLNKTAKAFSDCIAVKDTVTSWWEQPAQFVVPWVTLEDQNVRQWTDQCTLSATRLRQLQMNHWKTDRHTDALCNTTSYDYSYNHAHVTLLTQSTTTHIRSRNFRGRSGQETWPELVSDRFLPVTLPFIRHTMLIYRWRCS